MTESPKYAATDLILATSATAFTGMSVIFAEFNVVSTVLEVITFAQEVFNAREKYPHNSLIQAMTSSFGKSIKEKTVTDSTDSEESDVISPVQEQLEKKDPATLVDFTMDLLGNVFDGLKSKVSPEELQEFKQFLYELGESIANAAGEGVFGTGTKISEQETKVLNRLKSVLGI